MATVHPSRMGLIPQEMRPTQTDRTRGRSPSPRRSRRTPSPRRSMSRERDRERGRDEGYSRRDRDRSADRGREPHRLPEPRRSSPKYDDYRRLPPPSGGESSAPWRQQGSMYPPRRDNHGPPQFHGTGTNAGFLESRRLQREAQVVNVWPQSPKAPARALSPKGKRSSKKSKRHRSVSSDTDSSEEERRREKKERKRARRHEKDERKEEKRRHRHKSPHSIEEEDSDAGHRHKQRRRRSRSRTRSKSARAASRSRSRTPQRMDEDRVPKPVHVHSSPKPRQVSIDAPPSSMNSGESDSDAEVGPKPPVQKGSKKKFDERAYGGALLRGEGSAMAAFLQDGTEARIPRRGEIGLTPDEIAKYEDVGYVMSGSRHRRMNAVRMRKENQVISAEEKRGILKLQREERERKEAILRDEFSLLVDEKLKGSGAPGL